MNSKCKVPSSKAVARVHRSEPPKADERCKAAPQTNALVAALTADQRAALVAIASGQSFSEAARTAGISRQTLYEWRQSSPIFVAALNAWQSDARASAQNRLVGLTDLAVDAVAQSIQKGDVRIAWDLLGKLGLLSPKLPGPSDPAEIEEQAFAAKTKRESNRVAVQGLAATTALVKNFT
jgi:hypothetical protein